MKNSILALALFLWAITVVLGIKILIDYSKNPGPEGSISSTWPTQTVLEKKQEGPTLVMTLHSMCSCSRASVEELAKIMSKTADKIQAFVLIVPVEGQSDEDVQNTFAWKRSLEISNVKLFIDHEGAEAKKFGALVSGKTMLFDASGKLLFHGGITAGRGHEGDNVGRNQILSWILPSNENKNLALKTTPVFGCHLFESMNHETDHHYEGEAL